VTSSGRSSSSVGDDEGGGGGGDEPRQQGRQGKAMPGIYAGGYLFSWLFGSRLRCRDQ
jgi:hypothetical protein